MPDSNLPEDFDQTLRRLFAEAPPPEAADEFAARMAANISRGRRTRRLQRVMIVAILMVVAAAVTPFLMRASIALAARFGEWLSVLGALLMSPVGWVFGLGIAAWVLRRAGVRLGG